MRAVRVLAFLGALALLVALATAQEPETTEPEKPDVAPLLAACQTQLADMTSKFQSNQAIVDKYHEMSERLTAAVTEKLDMKQEKVALKEEVAKLEEEVAKLLNRPEPGALDLCAKLEEEVAKLLN